MMHKLLKRCNHNISRGSSSIKRLLSVKILGDEKAFNVIHQASGKKIYYFTATWCPPCKRIAPFFDKLSKAHPTVTFVKIDVDVLGNTAEEYKISSVPTFIFINDQKEVTKFSGASENDLTKGCEELEKL